jgi:hypothetical protein
VELLNSGSLGLGPDTNSQCKYCRYYTWQQTQNLDDRDVRQFARFLSSRNYENQRQNCKVQENQEVLAEQERVALKWLAKRSSGVVA